jgi:hypothetical protein
MISGTKKASYYAYDVPGGQSLPEYGLRLDGFFGDVDLDNNIGNDEVTFSFQTAAGGGSSVAFQTYDTTNDGKADRARLWGLIEVAEVNTTAPPPAGLDRQYLLDVEFDAVSGQGSSGTPDYWTITNNAAAELTNTSDPNDTAQLVSKSNGTFAYVVENNGAGKNTGNFGARGWVNYTHDDNSDVNGSLGQHITASDFLMDLEFIDPDDFQDPTVPEPTSLAIFGAMGLLGVAGIRRRKQVS